MEDRIPGWLQHCQKACCEKGGCCRRWACIIRRQYHYGNVISGWVDLHMTSILYTTDHGLCTHYN